MNFRPSLDVNNNLNHFTIFHGYSKVLYFQIWDKYEWERSPLMAVCQL